MLAQNSALIVFFPLLFRPLRALGALTTGFLEAEITLFALGAIFLDVLTKTIRSFPISSDLEFNFEFSNAIH